MLTSNMDEKIIAFTIDIDWAPEEAISDTMRLFEEREIAATLFCTHDSATLQNANRTLFELGVHPNFNALLTGNGEVGISPERLLDDALALYPESVGIRSHSTTQNSPLLNLMASRSELAYEANAFYPYNWNLGPYILWNGLRRVPYNWEDDIHFEYEFAFDDLKIDFAGGNYFVFDFHPAHIALNTYSRGYYAQYKAAFYNGDTPMNYQNSAKVGARDALSSLLDWVEREGHTPMHMRDIAQLAVNPGQQYSREL